ncbi:pheromone A receptor-domain-containing protein [Mycena rosella]|uniref:Pheromone A receptor-domain-containing protein n=1 Tax=Mycena rosella TaxID=1033263 RepID=A0AAD7CP02_MYCRO|nr:pheromone A receptor-domain-containing protein [Mycena rosella]
MGASVGIPAAALCITRRLYLIASVKTVSILQSGKRRAALIDALICVLFPSSRSPSNTSFKATASTSYPALYNSLPMYLIWTMLPPLLGLLLSASPVLTASRYLRLIALALASTLLTAPLGALAIYLNLTASPVGPWRSLSDTHFMFGRVEKFPAILWRGNHLLGIALELKRWASPACALIFFGFFGFAVEARRNYGLLLAALAALFWRSAGRFGGALRRQAPCSKHDVSLPAYSSFSGTGSLTGSFASTHGGTELKRAGSMSSSLSSGSQFREDLLAAEGKTQEAEAGGGSARRLPPYTYALPLHAGWADGAYPASGYRAGDIEEGREREEEEAQWSPVSDAHSVQLNFPARVEGRTRSLV